MIECFAELNVDEHLTPSSDDVIEFLKWSLMDVDIIVVEEVPDDLCLHSKICFIPNEYAFIVEEDLLDENGNLFPLIVCSHSITHWLQWELQHILYDHEEDQEDPLFWIFDNDLGFTLSRCELLEGEVTTTGNPNPPPGDDPPPPHPPRRRSHRQRTTAPPR